MNPLHHLPKFLVAPILQRHYRLLQRILLRMSLIAIGSMSFSATSWADNKMSAEEAFLQGQQHVEQANTPLAELSLTRIPPASPYAKLLAGNIAAKNGEFDRTFLLLLPLQSNNTFTKAAAASLHASLSSAYEKQGDTANAVDQLMRREAYLENAEAINSNHNSIWRLLSGSLLEDLITMRGESADTTIQGWIDLSLVAKNQDVASGLSAWVNSYPDHAATAFAKNLASVNSKQPKALVGLPSRGSIALVLPFGLEAYAAKADAFKLGLQAALTKHGIPNAIKIYPSSGNKESATDQYTLAKSEGAAYIIGLVSNTELVPNEAPTESGIDMNSIALLDVNTPETKTLTASNSTLSAGLSLKDEAQTIAAFATSNAIQHVVIVATDSEAAKQMVDNFQAVWETALGYQLKTITLPHDIKSGDTNLLDLKTKISEQAHDMVLLVMSAAEARIIRPYLDISTPTLAFSSIYEVANDTVSNTSLNAVRFVDIPFLLAADDAQLAYYRSQSIGLNSNELLRWFALGVDYLQLLIASTHAPGSELVINGLTGKLTLDKTGPIKRQLSMARFTYDGVVLEK